MFPVHDEVEAEELETVGALRVVETFLGRVHGECDGSLDVGQTLSQEGRVALLAQVLFELLVTPDTVGLGVVGTVLLNGIVRQVDELILDVGHVEHLGRQTQISLFEHIQLTRVVQQHQHPDIELELVQQVRLLQVLLNHERGRRDFYGAGIRVGIGRGLKGGLFKRGV